MTHFLAATKINQQQSAEFYEALGRACAARGYCRARKSA